MKHIDPSALVIDDPLKDEIAKLFKIESFLKFLDNHPDNVFDVSDSGDCAFARYLRAYGNKGVNVVSEQANFYDRSGRHRRRKLPLELGHEHCKADRFSGNLITYATLARRIRSRVAP